MKKIAIACIYLSSLISIGVWANASRNLKNRLDKVSSFHATFTQKVKNGNEVQEGNGDLFVKRPNLFNWHMIHPDESVLISDGKTLWFYNPFIEQVTAMWLKDAMTKTPFILISRNKMRDWKQYNITQKGDDFILTPKGERTNLKQFTISISCNGRIYRLCIIEQDERSSTYEFTSQKNGIVDLSKFSFTPPKGVTIDDQRNGEK